MKVAYRSISQESRSALVRLEPDQRHRARCHTCGQPARTVHSTTRNFVRNLSLADFSVMLQIEYRKVWRGHCGGVRVEQLGGGVEGRTRRLVRVGAQLATNSSGSIPQQTWPVADMKAAYRLFAEEDVTHERVCDPHFWPTRAQAEAWPRVFLVQDTMVLDYTGRKIEGLGPIGDGHGQGLHQQNVLAVDAVTSLPLGLLYQ